MKRAFPIFACLLLMLAFHLSSGNAQAPEKVIKISAKKFSFSPEEISLKKGVPVTLELTSEDRVHGFNSPDLKARATILPGKTTTVKVVPDKVGTFPFFCDIFCGSGHEGMNGTITVTE